MPMGVPAPTTSPLVHRYTLEEFRELEPPPGGGHWELIAGVLYMVPPPARPHGEVVSRLVMIIAAHLLDQPERGRLYVPRAAVWTRNDTWLEPDLYVVATDRLQQLTDDDPMSAADLVVEVSSPSTSTYDRTTKADTYAALGVRELWRVDMERRAIERRITAGATMVFTDDEPCESAAFPGLRATPRQLFG
jgi:Uma2 family endonuclease